MGRECHEFENVLSHYLEGVLPDGERQEAQQHLESCDSCSQLLTQVRSTLALFQAFPRLEPPQRLVENILVRTSGRYQSLSWLEYLRELFRPIYASPRFATGLCMGLLSFAMVMNAMGFSFSKVRLSDLTPQGIMKNVNLAYDNGIRRIHDLKIFYQIQSRIDELKSQPEENAPNAEDKSKEPEKPRETSAAEHLLALKVMDARGRT